MRFCVKYAICSIFRVRMCVVCWLAVCVRVHSKRRKIRRSTTEHLYSFRNFSISSKIAQRTSYRSFHSECIYTTQVRVLGALPYAFVATCSMMEKEERKIGKKKIHNSLINIQFFSLHVRAAFVISFRIVLSRQFVGRCFCFTFFSSQF